MHYHIIKGTDSISFGIVLSQTNDCDNLLNHTVTHVDAIITHQYSLWYYKERTQLQFISLHGFNQLSASFPDYVPCSLVGNIRHSCSEAYECIALSNDGHMCVPAKDFLSFKKLSVEGMNEIINIDKEVFYQEGCYSGSILQLTVTHVTIVRM